MRHVVPACAMWWLYAPCGACTRHVVAVCAMWWQHAPYGGCMRRMVPDPPALACYQDVLNGQCPHATLFGQLALQSTSAHHSSHTTSCHTSMSLVTVSHTHTHMSHAWHTSHTTGMSYLSTSHVTCTCLSHFTESHITCHMSGTHHTVTHRMPHVCHTSHCHTACHMSATHHAP